MERSGQSRATFISQSTSTLLLSPDRPCRLSRVRPSRRAAGAASRGLRVGALDRFGTPPRRTGAAEPASVRRAQTGHERGPDRAQALAASAIVVPDGAANRSPPIRSAPRVNHSCAAGQAATGTERRGRYVAQRGRGTASTVGPPSRAGRRRAADAPRTRFRKQSCRRGDCGIQCYVGAVNRMGPGLVETRHPAIWRPSWPAHSQAIVWSTPRTE